MQGQHTVPITWMHSCPFWAQILKAWADTVYVHSTGGIKQLTYCWESGWLCRGGFITHTGHMEPSASQTPSYSMPVEHWFSTLLAYIIPPFLRGKLPGWKKQTPYDRLVLCATEFRLQAGGEEKKGRARREEERMKMVHSGGAGGGSHRGK